MNKLLQKRLKHSTDNEVNILATLVGLIMPAYLPSCYAYFEVRPVVLQYRKLRIVVSADGLLHCTNGKSCENYEIHGERKIALEFKSPYSTSENPHVTVYETPPRNVPKISLEMKVLECSELWLLFGTKKSITVMRCIKEEDMTLHLLDTAESLYGIERPSVSTQLHVNIPM